ncbi:MAG TPA: Rieske 2Fe-2S domain-containing protein [Burkholderiaceae bacterium]|nr:Rieske 2Fe-2S domain-containing protein [Burkholderiaceae bacterium]
MAPEAEAATQGRWHELAQVHRIPEGPSLWTVGSRSVLIVRQAGRFFAAEDSCPHAGASLCNGRFTQGRVQCRSHGLRFDLATGRSLVGGLALTTFAVRVRDDRMEVLLADPAAA